VPSKEELGRAVGLDIKASSVAVVDPREAKEYLDEIVKKLSGIRGK
jgi:large subunit ribosomal protein L7Ae